jgi:FimV-like protein
VAGKATQSDHQPGLTRRWRGHRPGSTDPRAEPQGPLGHFLQTAIDSKRLSYPRLAELVNASIKEDTGKAARTSGATVRNWISRWIIPLTDSERALAHVLGISTKRLAQVIEAQRAERAEVWRAEQEAREAVARRQPAPKPNKRLRDERRRRGWTQVDVVKRMYQAATDHRLPIPEGLDNTYISKYERGQNQPSPHHVHLLCLAFNLPSDRLGLPGDSAPSGQVAARIALPAPIELALALLSPPEPSGAEPAGAGPALDPVDSDDMRRRQAVKLLLAAGAAAGGLDLERLARILDGTRVDAPGLNDLEALTGDFIRREATMAPHTLLPAVRGHLNGLHETLVWTPSSLASRAYSLAGQTALLAGYLSFKQDQRAQADIYYTLADRYGEAADDVRLRAAVLLLLGWRWHEENPSRAIATLDRAGSILGAKPNPAAAAAILCWRGKFHAEAVQADPTHDRYAMRDVQDAQAHTSRLLAADSSFYIFESVEGEVTANRALTFLHLNRPKEAAAETYRLLTAIAPESLSWRSFTTTDLATAYADMGDPEHAFELLMEALRLAASASALRCVRWVRVQRQRWPSLAKYDGPAARRLDEQLHALAAPPTPGLSPG